MEEQMKKCRVCLELKPLSHFHKKKGAPDGHRNECNVCAIIIRKTYTDKEDKEEAKKKHKFYYDRSRKKQQDFKKEHPELANVEKPKIDVDENSTKECRICHEIKSLKDYHKYKKSPDGHATACKICSNLENIERSKNSSEESKKHKKEYSKEYSKKRYEKNKEVDKPKRKEHYEKNKETIKPKNRISNKKYYEKNKDKVKEKQKKFYKENDENREKRNKRNREYEKNNKEKIKVRKKIYTENNKEKIKATKKNYRDNNREKINETRRQRKKVDVLYKLTCDIRGLISSSIKSGGYTKKTRTYKILGCTFEEFKLYIESKFEPWMNWENRGNPKDNIIELNKTWDIDHITPTSSATTEEEIIKLNHYTNLQPLCSYTNR